MRKQATKRPFTIVGLSIRDGQGDKGEVVLVNMHTTHGGYNLCITMKTEDAQDLRIGMKVSLIEEIEYDK